MKTTIYYGNINNLDYLYKYAEYTDYIGIGQIAKMNRTSRTALLNRIFKEFNNNNEIGFHGFGIGSIDMIKKISLAVD